MKSYIKKLNILIVVLAIASVTVLAIHLVMVYRVNHQEHLLHGADQSEETYLMIDFRGDATSRWTKRDYNLYGKIVDLTGTTIDENLVNQADYALKDWSLRINILGDCLINQAWNGQMEIHQFAGTKKEKVQCLNLQDYQLEDVELEYLYDGDLLIPLQAGDYLIYHPSEIYKEISLASKDELKIGTIFYFIDAIDLSDYEFSYTYYRSFTQGYGFDIFIFLCFALLITIAVSLAIVAAYKETQKQLDLQRTSVSCMSDIYQIIYLITPSTDTLVPVHADELSENLRPKNIGAREQIKNLFCWDAEDVYLEIMLEFADLDTIGQRLTGRNSVACEYISKNYGWCSIRIFAMDPQEDVAPERILFTIQVIDQEKRELENIRARVSEVEQENKTKSQFLNNISTGIRIPICDACALGEKIQKESTDPMARECAAEICNAGTILLSMVDGMLDFSEMETGQLQLREEEYSLKELIQKVRCITKMNLDRNRIQWMQDVNSLLPEYFRGDAERLKQVLVNLIWCSIRHLEKGELLLSVYGKRESDHVHLLFSVKADGDLTDVSENHTPLPAADMAYNLSKGLLQYMGLELKEVSSDEASKIFYFEIDQSLENRIK